MATLIQQHKPVQIRKETKMKTTVIYHDNCADGFLAAYVAWNFLKKTLPHFDPMSYGDPLNVNLYAGQEVYILDFSLPPEDLLRLAEVAAKVTTLDHHKSAISKYEGIEFPDNVVNIFDVNKSGALLAWEYFHPTQLPPGYVVYADDYDRWQFKYPLSKPFITALYAKRTIWNFTWFEDLLTEPANSLYNPFIMQGTALLDARENSIQAMYESMRTECMLLNYYRGLAVNCPKEFASDMGNFLAKKSGTFGLTWFVKANGEVEVSLRSQYEYDVASIAEAFGGGGHKNAAGFKLASLEEFISKGIITHVS